MARVLLTTPYRPDPLLGGTDMFDTLNSRLARGHGVFGMRSHGHAYGLYLIAENIAHPATVLEHPQWDDFLREIARGYDVIGIQLMSLAVPKVAQMIRAIRAYASDSRIVIGGYGAGALHYRLPGDAAGHAAYIQQEADYICREEGVRFMRRLLDDRPYTRPLTQYHLPRQGAAYPRLLPIEVKCAVFLVSLGCPHGCDFCNTSAFFKRKKMFVADPEEIYRFMRARPPRHMHKNGLYNVFDEDLFLTPDFVRELGRLIRSDRKTWGYRYAAFGSIRSLSCFDPEELRACGVGSVWIGVESFVQPDGARGTMYGKQSGTKSAAEIFDGLQSCGIQTVGSLILGHEYHTPENLRRDIDAFAQLRPSLYQIAPVAPCPGTALYDRFHKEQRLKNKYTWTDVHLWSEAGFNGDPFTPAAIRRERDRAYERLAHANGPPFLQLLDDNLRAYDKWRHSTDPFLRFQAEHSRRTVRDARLLLHAVLEHPPSPAVAARAAALNRRARSLVGPDSAAYSAVGMAARRWYRWRLRHASPVGPRDTIANPPVRWTLYSGDSRTPPRVIRDRRRRNRLHY